MKMPSYMQKYGRDYAYVEYAGKRYRLPGKYGSDESKEAFRQFMATHVYGSRHTPPTPQISVPKLIEKYLDFAVTYYPRGTRHSEFENMRYALLPVAMEFGHLPASEFGPLALKAMQAKMIASGRTRSAINDVINRIRRCWRWGVSEQLIPADVIVGLESVAALKANKTQARESKQTTAVEWEVVCETLAYCSPQVASMILVQWYTGARSDSICRMRRDQFDVDGDPWVWRPRHKTEHLGVVVEIPIGPRCQRTLERYLFGETDYVFSPTTARRNPRYTAHYNSNSYYQHISRAIDRANAAGHHIPHWHPHQIRHSHEQRVERAFGYEAARTALAHTSVDTTRLYSSRDFERAVEISRAMG